MGAGIKPWSSGRTTSTLKPPGTSLIPYNTVLNRLMFFSEEVVDYSMKGCTVTYDSGLMVYCFLSIGQMAV